ncbi:putative tail fiber protein [Klebsiella phage vB_KpP-Screen]|nr:putative tail fiber protein [Klebsiella phage vB_KpP-Screen]CAD5239136.1 putative tail fiber protein [Klebsiella phage vB_KqP-Goliath]CAD5239714.1 putative tail fiber protein [Klebsiella phage vB_KpP-Yoda]
MAFSWQEQIKPAGTQDIQCDIEYLDKSYIHVYLDGVETTGYTWTSATNIRLNTALAASTTVLLIRKTEREYLYIEFASGAPFIETNVDTQNTQFLHLAQELVEGRAIPGFYGTISMNGYRITNLGDPVDARDAATKQYVDAGDARLDQRIDALDIRTTNLEQTFILDRVTVSYPWFTMLDSATDMITPEIPFSKAIVYLNGVAQVPGYSFVVVDGTLLFAETLPSGTLVAARLGVDVEAGDGYATEAALDNLVSSLGTLAYKGAAAAVADSTDTSNVAAQLNALLASLRTAGIINT